MDAIGVVAINRSSCFWAVCRARALIIHNQIVSLLEEPHYPDLRRIPPAKYRPYKTRPGCHNGDVPATSAVSGGRLGRCMPQNSGAPARVSL